MSDLRFAWPYIASLPKDEREAYTTTLPPNLDAVKVNLLIPTALWEFEPIGAFDKKDVYARPEIVEVLDDLNRRSLMLWTMYSGIMVKATYDMQRWYSVDLVRNYVQFKTESWPMYVKRRFWPSLAFGLTLYLFAVDSH